MGRQDAGETPVASLERKERRSLRRRPEGRQDLEHQRLLLMCKARFSAILPSPPFLRNAFEVLNSEFSRNVFQSRCLRDGDLNLLRSDKLPGAIWSTEGARRGEGRMPERHQ